MNYPSFLFKKLKGERDVRDSLHISKLNPNKILCNVPSRVEINIIKGIFVAQSLFKSKLLFVTERKKTLVNIVKVHNILTVERRCTFFFQDCRLQSCDSMVTSFFFYSMVSKGYKLTIEKDFVFERWKFFLKEMFVKAFYVG